MKIDRRSAVAVLCAVALCLAGLTVWDGIYHTRNTARTQLLEQLSDLSDYSSHYVRMYFDNLLQLSEDAALLIARNGDMLGADVLGSLDDVGERSGAREIVVTRMNGEYASTQGTVGWTGALEYDGSGAPHSSISLSGEDEQRAVCVTTPIVRNGQSVGQLEWLYDLATVSGALSASRLGTVGGFHVFAPGSGYVVCTAVQGLSGAGDAACSLSGAQFVGDSSYEGLMADVKAGRSNTVNYVSLSGERMLGFYTLLGINDWYIMSVIPESEWRRLSAEHVSVLLLMALKLVLLGGALAAAIMELTHRRLRGMFERVGVLTARVRKQDVALAALGLPPFEFDMHALAARPIDPGDHSHDWLLERILMPEHAGEIVDPRDEAAYLKLCDAILGARGVLSGDFRLRAQEGAATRMYRLVLSAPEHTADSDCTIVTLIDIDDVARRMDVLRQRAARDALTGLDTLSEFRLKAGELLEKRIHHCGALCVVRVDNADEVCDSAGVTRLELLRQGGALMRDALGECDVLARGVGGEYWAFSCDQTGQDIIQKGIGAVLDSAIGTPEVHLTFSCGIACAEPGDGIEELMRRANDAAQLAHKDGGNRVQHG